MTAGAGAVLALTPELLRGLQQSRGQIIQRAIPSSGEMLSVIGFARGNVPADHAALNEVLKTLVDNPGRLLDMVHGGSRRSRSPALLPTSSGFRTGSSGRRRCACPRSRPGHARRSSTPPPRKRISRHRSRGSRCPRVDLIHVRHTTAPTHLAVLKDLKTEGRVRYIGVRQSVCRPRIDHAERAHPAVTVVRVGTDKAKHMLDNIGGGIGRLPDEATRKRMADLVDSWA